MRSDNTSSSSAGYQKQCAPRITLLPHPPPARSRPVLRLPASDLKAASARTDRDEGPRYRRSPWLRVRDGRGGGSRHGGEIRAHHRRPEGASICMAQRSPNLLSTAALLYETWLLTSLPSAPDLLCGAQIDLKRSLPHPKKTRKIFVGGLGADVDDGALRHGGPRCNVRCWHAPVILC